MNKSYKKIATPYLVWLFVLAIIPVFIMLFLTFLDTDGIDITNISFTLENYKQLGVKSTLVAFKNSFLYAFISTIVCIVLGYFVAYRLFRSRIKNKSLVLLVLILPMWSNILLRVEALGNIMQEHNIITDILNLDTWFSIKGKPIAVIIGLIFTYLPFMILPIYTTLEKLDHSLEEASVDLGLTEFQTFWKVVLPLSSKGIVTGSIMVFLPCMSGFAIPQILGDGNILLIGNVIEQMFKNMNYNVGSLLALIILVLILGALMIINKIDKEGETLI